MTAQQLYDQTIKPLSPQEKLTLARLILDEVAPPPADEDTGFSHLQRLLPSIERLVVTEDDLALVTLHAPAAG